MRILCGCPPRGHTQGCPITCQHRLRSSYTARCLDCGARMPYPESTSPPPADELALAEALARVAPDEWAVNALVEYFADEYLSKRDDRG